MPYLPKRQKRRNYLPKEENRNPGTKHDGYKFYNTTFRRVSRRYRRANPMCEVFPELIADVTDHIIPAEYDDNGQPLTTGGAPLDERNFMAMSHKAHNIKRGMERHGFEVASVMTENGKVPMDRKEIIRVLRNKIL